MEAAANSRNYDQSNFQAKVTGERLRREYVLMRQLLTRVKNQVESLNYKAIRCFERSPLQDTNQQNHGLRFEENREIRRQLQMAVLDLKGIQTTNGREHRYLKNLQDQLQQEKDNGVYNDELDVIVSELTNEHDFNCMLKIEVQKMIAEAQLKTSKVKSPVHKPTKDDTNTSFSEDFSFLAHSYNLK